MKKLFLVSICLFLVGCSTKEVTASYESTTKITSKTTTKILEERSIEPIEITGHILEKEPTQEEYEVSLMAAGDNLYHSTVYKKGKNEDGTYNFDFVYENVKDLILSYDIAVVNQETVLIENEKNISSYPCFGTPQAAGQALINAGFDVMLGATNHSYDKKEIGVLDTVNFWEQYPDITYVGIHDSIEDYEDIRIIEKNNIKIAFLNYTYGLNGFVIPNEKYYLVDTLYDKEKIREDLIYAEENADITIVFPHWGNEYKYDESYNQIQWAEFFTENGADIIIGAHPHVVEPVKFIETSNGNRAICFYSLGNFVSGQNQKPRILGGIASLTIKKTITDDEVVISIQNIEFIPTVTHYNSKEHTIYLLEDYNDELAKNTNLGATCEYLWNLWNQINSKSDNTIYIHTNMQE